MAENVDLEARLSNIQIEIAKAQTNIEHAVTFKQLTAGVVTTILAVGGVVWWTISQSIATFERRLNAQVEGASAAFAAEAAGQIASAVSVEVERAEQRLIKIIEETAAKAQDAIDRLPESIVEANSRHENAFLAEITKVKTNINSLQSSVDAKFRDVKRLPDFTAAAGEVTGEPMKIYTWTGASGDTASPTSDIETQKVFDDLLKEGYISPTFVQPLVLR